MTKATVKKRTGAALRTLVCLALVIGLLPVTGLQAFAAEDKVYLEVPGDFVEYAGYNTGRMYADDIPVYCAEPDKATPSAGTYTKKKIKPVGNDLGEEAYPVGVAAAVLYYGWGGPGFDKSMWPSKWYDGTTMTGDNYWALTHILIAQAYARSTDGALRGTAAEFKTWVNENIMRTNAETGEYNENAVFTLIQSHYNSGDVPSEFIDSCYQLNTGKDTQTVLSYVPMGYIDLQKESQNPDLTDGNACYSFKGAKYGVYTDKACTDKVQTLTTDKKGYAKSSALSPGTYYVKEIKAPKGYHLDPRVHKAKVSSGVTIQVESVETPINDPASILVGKYDADTGEYYRPASGQNLPQGAASLAGAQFTVRYYDGFYDTAADAEASGAPTRTWVFATDENGIINLQYDNPISGDSLYTSSNGIKIIPRGTLVIQETKAPEGYILDSTVYVQKIKKPGDASTVSTYNEPQVPNHVKRGGVRIEKRDWDSRQLTPQGGASLDGTVFEITNESANSVKVGGQWYGKGSVVASLTIRDGAAATAADALPYGDYSVREVATGNGYLLSDGNPRPFSITDDGMIVSFDGEKAWFNQVERGGVRIEKRDLENGTLSPLGGASLDGTVFEITSKNDKPVKVDGQWYGKGSVVATIIAKDSVAATASNALPYGDYSVREVATGNGYLLSDGDPRDFSITRDGEIVSFAGDNAWFNQVKRGDLEFVKVREDDMKRLAGVPFRITSQTTGESHIIVTDDNGYASTAAAWNPHTQRTNANDSAAEGSYDDEAGVWFGLYAGDKMTSPDDTLGALPYDTYTIEELPCAANENLTLVKIQDVVIKRHNVTVDMGTIDDRGENKPYIHTSAADGVDGDKLVMADAEAVINDHVEYMGLTPGETYTMTATLMDKETGDAIPGATVTKDFTAESGNGSVEMSIPADVLALGGHEVVVFEELTKDGTPISDHKDLEDTEQTLRVLPPSIGTTAVDGVDGDKNVAADAQASVVDTVAYQNLVPGKEYKVIGQLMLKNVAEDGSVTEEPLLDADGNPVTSETTFTPEQANGTVDVTFTFDASTLSGKEIVAFEELSRNDVVLAVHADIEDQGQTVEIVPPSIGTTAVDGVDGDKNVVADPYATVVDTVAYQNLVPGKEYKVSGQLMLKNVAEDGSVTEEPLLDADGNPVTSETTFTPEQASGTVDVTFTFDASALSGKEIVAFEELSQGDVVLAVHTDIQDQGQTVQVVSPSIGTTALDGADGDKNVIADPQAVIVDTVAYANLLPGQEYELRGVLMDKATGLPLLTGSEDISEESLKAFTDLLTGEGDFPGIAALSKLLLENADIADRVVTASTAFTPETAGGAVDVTFTFDASRWIEAREAAQTVVFEVLFKDGKPVAEHTDLTDAGQTVDIAPSEIRTSASDKSDGDRTVQISRDIVIVDAVTYKNLLPGKEYEVQGVLMDKSTGKPLMVNDKQVTSSARFTPNQPDGTVELEFAVDTTALAGKEIVVFETLYKEGVEIAVHADLNDKDQTVTVEGKPTPGRSYDKTGDMLAQYGWILILVALAGAGAAVYGVRQRRIAGSEDTGASDNE